MCFFFLILRHAASLACVKNAVKDGPWIDLAECSPEEDTRFAASVIVRNSPVTFESVHVQSLEEERGATVISRPPFRNATCCCARFRPEAIAVEVQDWPTRTVHGSTL